jgi:nicotinamidase/pyrazinamidase
MSKIHLVVIDPQNDFMDFDKSSLPVAGAGADMDRVAAFISAHGGKLDDIHVTLDSHQVIDIAHPAWWKDAKGQMVTPFTLITASDIEAGIYTPRDPKQRQRSLNYVKQLEATGKYNLFIWPPHCIIGTWGHGIHAGLMDALLAWQSDEYAMVNYVTKGTNPFTEHYGGLMAEVPDPEDPSTQLNTGFLEVLQKADIILIGGEALSHCVKETINQIVDNIGVDHVKKIKILSDATSPVGQAPGGPDFPAIAKSWLNEIQKKGVEVTTTTDFFN